MYSVKFYSLNVDLMQQNLLEKCTVDSKKLRSSEVITPAGDQFIKCIKLEVRFFILDPNKDHIIL